MVASHQDILSSLMRVIFHQASQGVFYQGGLIKMASHHSGLLSGYQGGLSSGYEGGLSSWYQGGFSTGVPLVMLNYENQTILRGEGGGGWPENGKVGDWSSVTEVPWCCCRLHDPAPGVPAPAAHQPAAHAHGHPAL